MIQNLDWGRGKVPAESFIGTLRNFVVYFVGSKFHALWFKAREGTSIVLM